MGRCPSLSSSQLWLLFWGAGLPSTDPHMQSLLHLPRHSCFRPPPCWAWPVLRNSDYPERRRLELSCFRGKCRMGVLLSVGGKAVCVISSWGFGPGPQWTMFHLGCAQRMWLGLSWEGAGGQAYLMAVIFWPVCWGKSWVQFSRVLPESSEVSGLAIFPFCSEWY